MNDTEYDEMLGYDADHSDPSQYCRHGTFIGSWWGPDYMCFYCEMGEEPPTPEEQLAAAVQGWKKAIAEVEHMLATVEGVFRDNAYPYDVKWAHNLVNIVFGHKAHGDAFSRAMSAYTNLLANGVDPWGES